MKYIIYKITNLVNDKIYIGAHKTNNINDSYMGSGIAINNAKIKYGLHSFSREILYELPSENEMYKKEAEIVTEDFILSLNNYNIKPGGKGGWNSKGKSHFINEKGDKEWITIQEALDRGLDHHFKNKVLVKDIDGNLFHVNTDNENYKNGKYVYFLKGTTSVKFKDGTIKRISNEEFSSGKYDGLMKDMVSVKDKNGNTSSVSVNDPRYLSGELKHVSSGLVSVKDKNDNIISISVDDPRYLSGELKHVSSGLIIVKDKDGNRFTIKKDDPRYLSGELVGNTKGYKASAKTRKKMSNSSKNKIIVKDENGNKFQIDRDDPRYLSGKLKHITAGKVWIHDPISNKALRINKEDTIPEGWKKGRGKIK